MGSQPLSLPVIDISPFLHPASTPSARSTTTHALASAVRDYGFFYLTGHGIPQSTTTQVLESVRSFFCDSSPETKKGIRRQDPGRGVGDGARGYQVIGENVTKGQRDWHEGIDWYRPIGDPQGDDGKEEEEEEGATAEDLVEDPSTGDLTLRSDKTGRTSASGGRSPPYKLLQGINLWPSQPPGFRQLYTAYVAQVQAVGTAVLHALGLALDLRDPDTFVKATRHSFWVMRAIGYPPLDPCLASADGGGGGVSCGEHTDYGCLTLLLADDTRGALQVLHRRRDPSTSEVLAESWIDADPVPGAYVVNVGDMVERWTNGLVRSTLHRVVHRGENYRVSVPFFLEPDLDAVVEPLEECVERSGGVRKGERVRYGDHLASKVGGNFYSGGGIG